MDVSRGPVWSLGDIWGFLFKGRVLRVSGVVFGVVRTKPIGRSHKQYIQPKIRITTDSHRSLFRRKKYSIICSFESDATTKTDGSLRVVMIYSSNPQMQPTAGHLLNLRSASPPTVELVITLDQLRDEDDYVLLPISRLFSCIISHPPPATMSSKHY